MKVVKVLTIVSLINKVSRIFLKRNKQDNSINKKGSMITNAQNQPNINAC